MLNLGENKECVIVGSSKPILSTIGIIHLPSFIHTFHLLIRGLEIKITNAYHNPDYYVSGIVLELGCFFQGKRG